MEIRLLVLLSVQLLLLSSCGSNHDQTPLPNPQDERGNEEIQSLLRKPDTIIYSDISKFVLKNSCNECHSTKKNKIESQINFDSFETAQGLKGSYAKAFTPFNTETSKMYKVLIIPAGSLHMPPFNRPQLSKEQIDLVFSWIQNGAKKEISDVVEVPPSLSERLNPYFQKPESIDYQTVNDNIFKPKCYKCHSTESPDVDFEAVAFGQDMTDYESLLDLSGEGSEGVVPGNLIDRWVNEKQEDGSFIKVREYGSDIFTTSVLTQTMPPPKEGYEPINGLESKLLRLWILNCAIESYEATKDDDNLDEEALEKKRDKVRVCQE